MKDVLKTEEYEIPEGVTIEIKSRIIAVTGPRGTLTKNVRHVNMDIQVQKGKPNKVVFAVWQGGRKHVAQLRTMRSLVENLVLGVTKVYSISLSRKQCAKPFVTGFPLQDASGVRPFPH
jgi:large subunit ribosomal protein L9e